MMRQLFNVAVVFRSTQWRAVNGGRCISLPCSERRDPKAAAPEESVRPFSRFLAIIRRFRVDKATDLADKTSIKALLWPEATTMNVNATGVPSRCASIRL